MGGAFKDVPLPQFPNALVAYTPLSGRHTERRAPPPLSHAHATPHSPSTDKPYVVIPNSLSCPNW